MTATGAPGELVRAVLMGNASSSAMVVTMIGLSTTTFGIRRCRATAARSCPVEAPSDAPGPIPRRIIVFRCCSRWSMVLADAACWGLVEVVLRSGPHDRASPLGSFPVDLDIALDLPTAFAAFGALLLMFSSAIFHPCPKGPACAAPSVSRTVVLLVDLRPPVGLKSGLRTRTRASSCSALSSTTRSGAPLLSFGGAGATLTHRAPRAATSWDGIPRSPILDSVARLPARVTTGSSCLPASAEASSQRAGGGDDWEEGGGGDMVRRMPGREPGGYDTGA